jgi:hypothetical protein
MTQVASLLGVPDNLDVIAVARFGYPTDARMRGKKQRKTLIQVAHLERVGQPFG